MTDVVYRLATKADIPSIISLEQECVGVDIAWFEYEFVQDLLQSSKMSFVAVQGEVVVGVSLFGTLDKVMFGGSRDVVGVMLLGVSESHRNRGIAGILFKNSIKATLKRPIVLYTRKSAKYAQKIYEKKWI